MAKGKHGDKKTKKKLSAVSTKDGDKASLRVERKKHKGKKFAVDDESIKIMRKNLADIGCKLNEVDADGNCLFRALGDQLFGDHQQHVEIRKRVVDYIESKRSDFEPFMEDEEIFDHYCSRMREDSTWGGNQELYAAARLFSVYIVIHQENSRMVIECDGQKPQNVLHIAYHGSDHYDSVRSIRDGDLNAPPVEIELDIDGLRPEDLKQRWKEYKNHYKTVPSTASGHKIAQRMDGSKSPDDLAADMETMSLQAASPSKATASSSVVLSKKAQRLLKKQAKGSVAAHSRSKKGAML